MDQREEVGSRMVIRLEERSALDRSQVGSKAATLAELRQVGYPVPAGWILPIGVGHGAGEVDDSAADVEMALRLVLEESGAVSLAVRSSAISEDLAGASFAGQYETTLGVRGPEQLREAVRACWESLRSDRVVAYRPGREEDGGMAVLIQPMIQAQAAGVAFSAHPVTGARDEVVINAVAGLGDALVSGRITPAEWVVRSGQAHFVSGPEEVIDTSRAEQIAHLAKRVEKHFGVPQDIEWATEGDALHLLQARPITSLPEPPVEPIPIDIEIPGGYWQHDASHFPAASYPIDSMLPELVSAGVEAWVNEFGYLFDGIEFRDIGGWTYQRLRPIGGREGPDLPGWVMWLLVRTVPRLRTRISVAREAVRTDKPGQFVRAWYDTWLPELAGDIERLLAVNRSALADGDLLTHIDEVIRLAGRGIEVHSLVHGALAPIMYELVTTCDRLLGWDMTETLRMVGGMSFKSTEPARRLNELATMARPHPEILDVSGIPDDEIVAHLGQIDPAFASAFTRYLDEYGHRALNDSSAERTIAERPSFVLGMIRQQIASGFDPEAVDRANARLREDAIAAARRRLAATPEAMAEFDAALSRAQHAYPAREDNEFYTLSAPFALIRYVVLELGERLVGRNLIDHRDHVLFLHLHEAQRALANPADLRDRVRRRSGERAWAVANPGPPSYGKESPPPESLTFLPADARLPMESMLWSLESMMAIEASKTTQSDASAIRGTPVSAGSYTGPVRIVMGESEFDKLQAGDVLVCPITSPVWSILFPGIGALVTDSGGILSHPAIIAREYRVPAVVATGNATELLHDGQIVVVDGVAGTVEVVEEMPQGARERAPMHEERNDAAE